MGGITHSDIGRQYVSAHADDTMFSRGQWFRYVDGWWHEIAEKAIAKELWDLLEVLEHQNQCRPTANVHKSVMQYMEAELFVPEAKLDAMPDLVNLKSCVYDLNNDFTVPHAPGLYQTTQLPFDYVPGAVCPNWDYFLNSTFVLPESDTPDPDLISFLQEAIGYSLTTDISHHTMFWCYGEGSNGKGVLFHVLEGLAGESATPVNINILRREQYQLALLAGKRVALCSEANATDNLVEDAMVKALVAGDTIMVRMIRREPFKLHPTIKLWWSMNRFPAVADTSEGFWRRLKVVPFNRHFNESDRQMDLNERLQEELPGIFNWAMEGLHRLRKNGNFSEVQQVRDRTEKYRNESNVVGSFLEERYTNVTGAVVQSSLIYSDYKLWCSENTFHPLNIRNFGREMECLGYFKTMRNGRVFFLGLMLKP
jgi:putative DNA primase/helicase